MGFVQKNIFEELDKVRQLVRERLPGFDVHDLCVTLGRLGTYHYKRKSMIVGDERALYNLLIENSYNPYTVYRWALLERVPEEIKFQLRNYYVSQKKASQEYKSKELANIFIQVMGLEEYVKTIEKLEIQHYHILKEKKQIDNWVESFERLTELLPQMQKKDLTIFRKNIQAMKAFGG